MEEIRFDDSSPVSESDTRICTHAGLGGRADALNNVALCSAPCRAIEPCNKRGHALSTFERFVGANMRASVEDRAIDA